MSKRALAEIPDVAGVVLFLAFLFLLLQPAIPNPFQLEPATAWVIVCYAFAVPILLIHAARRSWWRPTPFDYLLCAYVIFVLVTWRTSVDRPATSVAIFKLIAQIAIFCATRLLVENRRTLGRLVVAALVLGIAILEWTATDFHLRYGLSERLLEFPALEWNGREGLGVLGAIQLALLIGIWQETRSRMVQLGSILLIIGAVAELIFFYSRAPWIAAAAVLLLALVVAFRIGGVRRYALAVGAIVAVIGLARTPYIVRLAKMAAGLERGAEGGLAVRLGAWRHATSVIRQHLFVGVGLGNFVAVRRTIDLPLIPHVPAGETPVHPHNIFLQQFAETGIAGGLAYVALWATALWAGWRTSGPGTTRLEAHLSVFYGLFAIAIVNMGENMFMDTVAAERVRLHTISWILMAVGIAGWNRLRQAERARLQDVA